MALQPHQQSHFQMSWQPSLLNPKRKTGPPLGLRNLGNSCYLNSVLQCLTYTPPLANFCLRSLHSSCCDSSADAERKRDCPFCILEKRIARSLKGDLAQDAPAKIQSCLRLFAEHFRCGRQEDAHEFLRYVIDACHNTCLRLKKLRQQQRKGSEAQSNGGNTIVKEIFGGALQSQVKCSSCGAESNKIDEIMDISLDIMYSSSLKDAMHKFFQPEVLDGNNKYKCENCKKLVVATKQMSVFQAPNILVIQLKRFEGIYGGKIDKMISFQEVLVLSGFMCKASQDPSPEYNLFGTIVHAGCSPDSGHYYSYIKDAMGRWYCCNDAFVSVATLEDVLSEKVYMLFFSRTKQRPVNTGHALSGVKSRDCTGNDTSKNDASASPPSKHIRSKPHVEGSPWQVISKSDKVPSGSRMKFSMVGNNGEKRVPSISNGKVDPSKVQLNRKKGESRDPIHAIKTEKHVATSSNGTCCGKENELDLAESKENQAIAIANNYRKDNENDAFDAKKSQAFASENGNGHFINGGLNSVKSVLCESNGTRSKEANGRGSPPLKLQNGSINGQQNGSINGQRDTSGAKRKLQDGGCVLLDQDAESRVQVEELKELLKSKVALELRTCGWLDEVQTFMRLKKRSYAGKLGHTSENADACKQRLIEDAKAVKPTFASRIPESLKQELINDLQSFSQRKG